MPLDLIALRKHVHQHPELSGKENNTAKFVINTLKQFSCTIKQNLGGTSLVAIFNSEKKGKNILFRAELDALPIQEINTFNHHSKTKGVSHKCGHDGHLCSLLALAELLHNKPLETGTVYLLFQSAEETGKGAAAVLNSAFFKTLAIDYAFAYHNIPGEKLNTILYKEGSFTAAVSSIIIRLKGKTAHAAEPENGVNPALAMAEILQKAEALNQNNTTKDNFILCTPVHAVLGEKAYGVAAGEAEVHFTLRAWQQNQLDKALTELTALAKTGAQEHNLSICFERIEEFKANTNNGHAVAYLQTVLEEEKLSVIERKEPYKWGEDFGLFTQHYPGAMFGIGAGESCPSLHNPDYDFPDAITPIAANLFYKLAQKISNL